MTFKRPKILMSLGLGFFSLASAAAFSAVAQNAAEQASLAMFNNITPGEWTLKFRDGAPARKVCVKTGQELIQLGHTQSNCSRFVVTDSASRATIQYTCRGDGYGRTDLRRESKGLIQVESQGIAGGAPFQFAAEARRTGGCAN